MKESLLKQIIDQVLYEYNQLSDINGLEVLYNISENHIIEEGLIKTESIEKTIQILKRNINATKNHVLIFQELNKTEKLMNSYFISVLLKDFNEEIINDIIRILNLCGWFFSCITYNGVTLKANIEDFKKTYKSGSYKLSFDAKYDIELGYDALPQKLYHATLSNNTDNILKNGIFPKNKSNISNYPSRVYLGVSPNECIQFIRNKLNNINKESVYNIDKQTIDVIEIDLTKLKQNYSFMKDSNSDFDAVYTYEPIPFYCLTLKDKIEI